MATFKLRSDDIVILDSYYRRIPGTMEHHCIMTLMTGEGQEIHVDVMLNGGHYSMTTDSEIFRGNDELAFRLMGAGIACAAQDIQEIYTWFPAGFAYIPWVERPSPGENYDFQHVDSGREAIAARDELSNIDVDEELFF